MFLLLCSEELSLQLSKVGCFNDEASGESNPGSREKPEVRRLVQVGYIRLILQRMSGDLGIRKVGFHPNGYPEKPNDRFSGTSERCFRKKLIILRISETNIFDHVVLFDCECWPKLMYDPSDTFPIMSSSWVTFQMR